MKPGIHKISNKAYHEGPGLSSSGAKELVRSAAHFQAYKQSLQEPTPQMIRGSLVHALILEPESFDSQFAVGNHSIRRGKDYEAAISDNPGKIIITRDDYNEAKIIVNAFQNACAENSELGRFLEGLKEMAFYWEDPATGILCKAKPDILTNYGHIIDIKTTTDASFDAFQKQMVDLKYFLSAAFYLRGVSHVMRSGAKVPMVDVIPTQFTFIVIETKSPFAVAMYTLSAKSTEFGDQMINRALDLLAEAVSTEVWSAYPKQPLEMDLPNWCFYKSNFQVGGIK